MPFPPSSLGVDWITTPTGLPKGFYRHGPDLGDNGSTTFITATTNTTPSISNVAVPSVDKTTATITFTSTNVAYVIMNGITYTTTSTINLTGLTANTTYNYSIIGYTASNLPTASKSVPSFTTLASISSPSTGSITSSSVVITFTAVATSVKLYKGSGDSTGTTVSSSYTASGLTANTTYSDWYLVPINSVGTAGSQYAISSFTTLATTIQTNSLSFNGSNQYAILNSGATAAFGNFTGTNGGTVEIWFKIPTYHGSSSGFEGLIVKQNYYGIWIEYNKIAVYDWSSGNIIFSTNTVADGLWHHVAYSFKPGVSNGSCLYLDGVLQGSAFTMNYASSGNSAIPMVLGIGGFQPDTSSTIFQQLFGSLAYLRIWNTAKSDTFISTNYKKYLNPTNNSDMVALYSLSEGSDTTLNNTVSSTYTFSLVNTPTWNTSGPVIN